MNDFLTKWLSVNHKYKPFKETKQWLEHKVAAEGIDTLFKLETNLEFASKIGGRENSFNYRETWPVKVIHILKNTGLNQLCSNIYYKKIAFKVAWKQY